MRKARPPGRIDRRGMDLGRLIRRLQDEDAAGLALAALDDDTLFAEVSAMAAHFGETPAAYIALAAARFANLAGDQDWTDVIGAAERAADPARAILARMLRWSLRRDAAERAAQSAPQGLHKQADGH